jgi:hypothetical protein
MVGSIFGKPFARCNLRRRHKQRSTIQPQSRERRFTRFFDSHIIDVRTETWRKPKTIADRDVHQTIFARQRHRWFGALLSQREKPAGGSGKDLFMVP